MAFSKMNILWERGIVPIKWTLILMLILLIIWYLHWVSRKPVALENTPIK